MNGLESRRGIPVPNLSEHANAIIAFSLWHARGNTHTPSSCGPKYQVAITSGVIWLSFIGPKTCLR